MYINIELFKSKNLLPEDLYYLIGISLKNIEVLENIPASVVARFEDLGFLTTIKGNKKDKLELKIRLNQKGKKFLKSLEQAPVLKEDSAVFEWLKNYYLKEGKDIGNGAKTQRHIRDFRMKSGIQKNNLVILVLDFLKENEERSRKLEYIWYYPKTVFDTKFDLEESWLYSHYLKNKERLDAKFEKY